jgi:hypothetical protein
MSEIVDGPEVDAFNFPNAVQIGRLELQINRLAKAMKAAEGPQKKSVLQAQINQLREQQRILYCQMTDVPDAKLFDKATVLESLKKQNAGIPDPPADAPVNALKKELEDIIAALGPARAAAAP